MYTIRQDEEQDRPKLGVSTCLLGENVRYDGGHKLDRYVRDVLGRFFRYEPVCPEVECGLPVPREAMRLVGELENPRLMTIHTQKDLTEQMQKWGAEKLKQLERENLCGYIFKSRSPSSGMERIKIYDEQGNPGKVGMGIWAKMFMQHFPLLPAEDEGRLHDPALRERFIEHVFVYWRWQLLQRQGPSRGGLVDFHTRHKYLIMAHSPRLYSQLGRLVAQAGQIPLEELLPEYLKTLDLALRQKTSVRSNTNVLQHMLGYFKDKLDRDEKQEFLEIVENYRSGNLPLIVPVTLINHFARKYGESYLLRQYYLNPHPVELKLRNHA